MKTKVPRRRAKGQALRTIWVTPDQVSAYINKNAWRYLELLKLVKDLLNTFRFCEGGRNAIYSIYSRGHRQKGADELKESWQVKEKVNKMRIEGIPQRRIPPNPNFPIQDVGDIVALTEVCVYPPDIDAVRKFIRQKEKEGLIKVHDEEVKEERGYRALHFILGWNDREYTGLRCELQVKTILHDAWSAKTHDLTYKPRGSLPKEVRGLFEDISVQLTAVDRMSEKFRDQIHKLWEREKKRKEASRLALLRYIVRGGPKNKRRRIVYNKIAKDLHKHENRYRKADVSNVISQIDKFSGTAPDLYSSQLITYLAALRESDDLDSMAIDHIDRWVFRVSGEELVWALIIKGLAFFSFNRISEAVETSEKAVEIAEQLKRKRLLIQAWVNLAHYLAELGGEPKGRVAQRARQLMRKAEKAAGGFARFKRSQKDTFGYVKIVFGRDRSEVQDGEKICKRVAPTDEVTRAFFKLHEEIARERLDEFSPA